MCLWSFHFKVILRSYLSERFGDHLANVLSPLWDVWVEAVQVCAEAQGDDLKVIWDWTEQEYLTVIAAMIQNSNGIIAINIVHRELKIKQQRQQKHIYCMYTDMWTYIQYMDMQITVLFL